MGKMANLQLIDLITVELFSFAHGLNLDSNSSFKEISGPGFVLIRYIRQCFISMFCIN